MTKKNLGTLRKIDLREVWTSETNDFTPWLAEDANLIILGETLGIDLVLEAQEKDVGPFRADLLCKDVGTDAWVLIENQLERTNHTHLGQLLTYSAGLQAAVVVWIASKFTEEHRAALDHLNEITDERYRFFGLEVELWQIGDSPPAPRFNLISKPNDWSRAIGKAARKLNEEPVSELKALQKRYWEAFNHHMEMNFPQIKTRKPRPRHWTTFSIGRSGMHLSAKVNTSEDVIGAELYLADENAKKFYSILENQKNEIEASMGEALSWEPLPDRKGCRIALKKMKQSINDEDAWAEQHGWLSNALNRLDASFRKRVQKLNLADYSETSGEE